MNNMNLINQKIFQNYLELKQNYLSKQKKNKKGQQKNYTLDNIFNYPFFENNENSQEKEEELNSNILRADNKKVKCKTFYEKGYCPLGSKCKYQHDERQYKDTNFSYFYIRLFLLKNFGYFRSKYNYKEKNSNLYSKRLSVFESLTKNNNKSNKSNKIYEDEKYDSSCDNLYNNNDIVVNFS